MSWTRSVYLHLLLSLYETSVNDAFSPTVSYLLHFARARTGLLQNKQLKHRARPAEYCLHLYCSGSIYHFFFLGIYTVSSRFLD
jgi:hypothetical protein